jgi:membrane-associated protease RseP (regulator of RpoE activity)
MSDFIPDSLPGNSVAYARLSGPNSTPDSTPDSTPKLRYRIPLLLLLATFCTTVLVGSRLQFNFNHNLEAFAAGSETMPLFPVHWLWQNPRQLLLGLPFSLAILSILLAHEMGHYLYCRRYRVRATLPFFIPAPTLIGTLGAFIRIGGRIESRAALFDIGIAGPIAGFVVAVPTMLAGLALSRPVAGFSDPDLQFGFPLIFQLGHLLLHHVFSTQAGPPLAHYYLHPVALAGWAGMLATSLNLLPGGQLDGGHIVFAVSPQLHRFFSRSMIASLLVMAWFFWVGWFVWAILLALSGLRQPHVPQWPGVGRRRKRLSLLALAMLILTFTPAPVANSTFPQVARMIKHGNR